MPHKFNADLAIELGLIFTQPLRQTEGLMRALAKLLGVESAPPEIPEPEPFP
ncbi:hypothetical protein DT23_09140 [Thioclava indica]|uniref:Uncharacterized protein n=1 Tax=Thioclava indica TaxID=1353528 RepID=A0A074J207_9RHOB|nr:hypothetical protein DT23_09140 [Thioclava indica]